MEEDRYQAFRPLLRFIYSGEGGYNATNQGTRINPRTGREEIVGSTQDASIYTGRPLTEMTIGEIMQFQAIPPGGRNRLFAVGALQIIPNTMREILPSLREQGIDEDTVFTEEVQDRIAIELMLEKRPILGRYLRGQTNNLNAAMRAFAQEWASVPDPATGLSFYHERGNRARHTVEEVRDELRAARTGYRLQGSSRAMSQEWQDRPELTEQRTGLSLPTGPRLRPRNVELPGPGSSEEIVQQGRPGLAGREQRVEPPNRPDRSSVLSRFAANVLGGRRRFRAAPLETPEPLQFETALPAVDSPQLSMAGPQIPMASTRTPYSPSVFASPNLPARPTPSYAMGGYVGPSGQPVVPAGLTPPEVGMDVTPEQIDQTVNQTMQANPQMVQQIQQLIMESVQSGELTMQELNTLGQMAQAALQDPNLYPQLRQMAIREGLATAEDIPPQFDPALITVMLVAIRSVRGMGGQEQAQPQMMSMAMGGVVPISKKQSVDPRHNKPVVAELEEGEYVIPKNVVEMKGREFFDSLIKKYTGNP